jgi:hypothetical protein
MDTYETYCRWATGPLMSREAWEADRELASTDFAAWLKRHGIG